MLTKNTDLTIDPLDPFKNDCLDRKQNIVELTNLVRSSNQPFVMSVEAPWGWGKTTFVRLWKTYLEQESNLSCLYFNAWSNDFAEDPLIAFLSEMKGLLEIEKDEGKNQALNKALRKAQKFGAGLFRRGLPLAIRLATQGIINEQSLVTLKGAGDGLGEFFEQIAEDRLKAYEQEKDGIKAFRESLEEFAKLVINGEDGKGQVVFFVDELDRCRPDYAIELLERIKHLFNVEGVVFVLSIDRQQLVSSIKSIYGNSMDADGYLRRFIDISYRLPEPSTDAFCNILFDRFQISDVFLERRKDERYRPDPYDEHYLKNAFIELAKSFKFSLRVQEQCLTEINIILRTTGPKYKLYPHLLSFLVSIKAYEPELYQQFHNKIVDVEDLITTIKKTLIGSKFLEQDLEPQIAAYIIGNYCGEENNCGIINKFRELIENNGKEEISMEQKRAIRIIDILQRLYRFHESPKTLSHVIYRLDNIGKFFV